MRLSSLLTGSLPTIVLAALLAIGCAAPAADEEVGEADVVSAAKGDELMAKLAELLPDGHYVGRTPSGETCDVSVSSIEANSVFSNSVSLRISTEGGGKTMSVSADADSSKGLGLSKVEDVSIEDDEVEFELHEGTVTLAKILWDPYRIKVKRSDGNDVSLEIREIKKLLPDPGLECRGLVRKDG